ncbi:hypothetical protein [Kineococcus arenarius]
MRTGEHPGQGGDEDGVAGAPAARGELGAAQALPQPPQRHHVGTPQR